MAVILFGVFIALLLLGVPVAFAICSAAATTMFAGFGDAKMMIVVQRMFASCDSFSLIAVPFFIFAGDLLAGGRISKVLVEFCESLLGMIKGGLSVVSVLAGMFFAAISGSGAATTAAVGATLVPELKKRGYRRGLIVTDRFLFEHQAADRVGEQILAAASFRRPCRWFSTPSSRRKASAVCSAPVSCRASSWV